MIGYLIVSAKSYSHFGYAWQQPSIFIATKVERLSQKDYTNQEEKRTFASDKQPHMKFTTPVELPEQPLQLTPRSHIMTIGSCFANHIGQRLTESLPQGRVIVNPRGTLYNPLSIALTLASYLNNGEEASLKSDGFFEDTRGDGWRHWDYSTAFTASTQAELQCQLQQNWRKTKEHVEKLDGLFITFSTNHAYCLNEGDYAHSFVANCHKQPRTLFTERSFTFNELYPQWEQLLNNLHTKRPGLKVVITVSPYRYAKYGMHENALSKAHLLLLAHHLCTHCHDTLYFPAYEIVNDELRDYRFYAPDLLHPSEQAIDYIWERFTAWCFTPELQACAKERMALIKARSHRPTNAESENYRSFLKKLEEKELAFEKKWNEGR